MSRLVQAITEIVAGLSLAAAPTDTRNTMQAPGVRSAQSQEAKSYHPVDDSTAELKIARTAQEVHQIQMMLQELRTQRKIDEFQCKTDKYIAEFRKGNF